LIIDETSTGCGASGNGFWQNESTIADYVAFGKRT
jgi:acetylornithine/succinyldiaminopimelate/putrescine aminotransferase